MKEMNSAKEENNEYYEVTDRYVARTIAGETVLVPVGQQTISLNGFITFTDTGQFLWKLLAQKKCTEADLVQELLKEYNCTKEEVHEDVTAFLKKAVDSGVVKRSVREENKQ